MNELTALSYCLVPSGATTRRVVVYSPILVLKKCGRTAAYAGFRNGDAQFILSKLR